MAWYTSCMNREQVPQYGILALQGDFERHRDMLARLGIPSIEVRKSSDLKQADALILPGGESTTIIKLLERSGLDEEIQVRAAAGMPIYGTCAGLIVLAKGIEQHPEQPTLGLVDVIVARNAFGRQIDSFEADIPLTIREDGVQSEVRGVFIRAPYITEAATAVQVLGRYNEKIVAVRQGNLLATAFHPELTNDSTVHSYFIEIVSQHLKQLGGEQ